MTKKSTIVRYASLLAAVIAVLFGGAHAGTTSVVYPTRSRDVIFSHASHQARKIECVACHSKAASSQSAVDNLLPTEFACRTCHVIDRSLPLGTSTGAAPSACVGCHLHWQPDSVVAPGTSAPPSIKFSHAKHAASPCQSCHRDSDLNDRAPKSATLPVMATCVNCHSTDGGATASARKACTFCHLSDAAGALRTQLPDGVLMPRDDSMADKHGPGFATDHARAARNPARNCASCHRESYCSDCHNGVAKPTEFHAAGYLEHHAIEAKRGSPDCSACHRAATFCVACHERAGVGTRAAPAFGTQDGQRLFHPSGWAGGIGASNLHAGEALRNLATCASCHRDNDCIRCHSAEAGSMQASPHPAGWRNSAQCEAMDRRNRRMCLRCHVTAAEVGCDW
jgi:hypothetical protein